MLLNWDYKPKKMKTVNETIQELDSDETISETSQEFETNYNPQIIQNLQRYAFKKIIY